MYALMCIYFKYLIRFRIFHSLHFALLLVRSCIFHPYITPAFSATLCIMLIQNW